MSSDLNRKIWLNGKIISVIDAEISVLSPTAQFGVNVFEGIRCYWNQELNQLYAFRLDEHLARLKYSQKLLDFDDVYSTDELRLAFIETIKANMYKEDIAVRQTLFIDGFGTWHSTGPVNMFVSPVRKSSTNPEYNMEGLNCCVSSWRRIDDNSISPRIKSGANYLNSRMAQREAMKNGYDTAIFLNKEGKVSEGPGSCIFMFRKGKLITPALTDSILESITRDTIISLARDILDIEVIERSIDRTELYMCEEAFLCGSSMEITPIYSIDRHIIGDNKMGINTKKIYELYLDVVKGNVTRYKEWNTGIY